MRSASLFSCFRQIVGGLEKAAKTLCYNFCIAAEKHCFIASGGIAQLGERLHGMQEVIGSI
ncbi:hypothetical protein, partial [Comamonas testosteroni]|uniref:hypothetical protein n=1 Tax=Comamonas testosteroni TaxID=285 RepID=UPI001E65D038